MPKDSGMEAGNERIRQEKIAREKAEIKKHGQKMDQAVRGSGQRDTGRVQNPSGEDKPPKSGCLSAVAILAAVPLGLWLAEKLA